MNGKMGCVCQWHQTVLMWMCGDYSAKQCKQTIIKLVSQREPWHPSTEETKILLQLLKSTKGENMQS